MRRNTLGKFLALIIAFTVIVSAGFFTPAETLLASDGSESENITENGISIEKELIAEETAEQEETEEEKTEKEITEIVTEETTEEHMGSAAISIAADKMEASVGDTINYTITVTNNTGKRLYAPHLNVSNNCGAPVLSSDVHIAQGATETYLYQIQAGSDSAGTNIECSAFLTYGNIDARVTVNASPVTVKVKSTEVNESKDNSATVNVMLSADRDEAAAGDTINYTVTVTNNTGKRLYAPHLNVNNNCGAPVLSSDVHIAQGATETYFYQIQAGPDSTGTNIECSAFLTYGNIDARVTVNAAPVSVSIVAANETESEESIPDENEEAFKTVTVKFEADHEKAAVGETVNYTVSVTNNTEDRIFITSMNMESDNCLPAVSWNGFSVKAGETVIKNCSHKAVEAEAGMIINSTVTLTYGNICNITVLTGDPVKVIIAGAENEENNVKPLIPFEDGDEKVKPLVPFEDEDEKVKPLIPFEDGDEKVKPLIPFEDEDEKVKPLVPFEDEDEKIKPLIPSEDEKGEVKPVVPEEPEENNNVKRLIPAERQQHAAHPEKLSHADTGYELTELGSEQIPLANQNLGEHRCCIAGFVLMLAAFIVLCADIHCSKKHQAKMFELRKKVYGTDR